MFGPNATQLARIDWAKYGQAELQAIGELTPDKLPQAVEQLQRAVQGAFTGLRQLSEELANLLGNRDISLVHTGPLSLTGYEPSAPGVSPDDEVLENFHPRVGTLAHDSVWDNTSELATGGLAGVARGVWFFQPAIKNPVVAGGAAINKIVQVGGLGAGIRWDNIFVNQIYNQDGTKFCPFPVGFMMPYALATATITANFSLLGGTWALMDGTANAAGSGIDMRGQVGYGLGTGDFATVGATIAVALTVTISGAGTVTSSSNGSHNHDLTQANLSANLIVTTPAFVHSGSGSVATAGHDHTIACNFTQFSPVSGTNAVTTIGGINSDGDAVTTSVNDTIAGSAIAAALGNHAATACTVTTDAGDPIATEDNGAHTHTSSISTIAGGLTVGTPSVLRAAGKVIVWIERVA